MAKFAVGQAVEVAFNPQPVRDPLVREQSEPWTDSKGRRQEAAPGRGEYQTKPDRGKIIGVLSDTTYMVLVDLVRIENRNGDPYPVTSKRKRIIDEAKLIAV